MNISEARPKVDTLTESTISRVSNLANELGKKHYELLNNWESGLFDIASHDSLRRLWVTEEPEAVFRLDPDRPYFHVTTTHALVSLGQGIALIPPSKHSNEIKTGMGTGLSFSSRLFHSLEISEGGKDLAVWVGTNVDQEQIAYLSRAQDVSKENHIDQTIEHLLQIGMDGTLEDHDYDKWIDSLMSYLSLSTGLREGWLRVIEERFRNKNFGHNQNLQELCFDLNFVFYPYNPDTTDTHQAIVLEVDPVTSFKSVSPLYPVIVSGRDPEQIIPLPNISRDAIKNIYVEDPNVKWVSNLASELSLPISNIDTLPKEFLLDPTMPSRIDKASLDPYVALCQKRYTSDPQSKWRRIFERGLIAPYMRIKKGDDHASKFMSDVFGAQYANFTIPGVFE